MPKKATELAAYQIKRLKRPGLHAVGGVSGLHLNVKASGARHWVLRIVIGDRRRDLGLGGYPDVTLADARNKAREIRQQVAEGIDPIAAKKALQDQLRAANAKRLTFKQAAIRCHAARSSEFTSTRHSNNWLSSLEMYAFPILGNLPIDQIDVSHIEKTLQPHWLTKTSTLKRVRQRIETVLSWAAVGGYRSGENPARWKDNLAFIMANPSKITRVKHFPALPWAEMGAFMKNLRQRNGMGARALEFAILTAARSGEVRLATWAEIDLDAKLWTISAERMKANKAHRVALSQPAIDVLKALPQFAESEWVFTAARGGPLSDMTVSAVTRRMGVDAVPHGFRSTFKDWARTSTAFADEVTELALAHVNSDATRAAYARDELLPKRARLMDAWAEFISEKSAPGNPRDVVTPLRSEK